MSEAGYHAVNISKRYGPIVVLDNATVFLRRGEVHGLVGHNGAGKSTFIKLLAGALAPDSGKLLLDGKDVSFASPADAGKAGVACVFQELSLLNNLTVAQNLFLGDEITKRGLLDRTAMIRSARDYLAASNLALTGQEKVSNLPVAIRQMVEIVGALRRKSAVILLDEPTTSLESSQIDQLLESLRRIAREKNVAIAIVDHKLDEIFAVCDRITALVNGRVVLTREKNDVSRSEVVAAIVGAEEARLLARRSGSAKPSPTASDKAKFIPAILTVYSLATKRGLVDVSFDIKQGEILGMYGLVGSGRSRLLKTLYGVEPIERGEISLRNELYRPHNPSAALAAGIAFVPEERKINGFIPQFNAIQNCVLPVLKNYSKYGIIDRQAAKAAALKMLKKLQIRGNILGPLVLLSGGNQQKALLARAMLQKPQLLLLDEPTRGIDVGTKAEIHSLIRQLAREQGTSVLIVSTEEEEILTVTDSVVIMKSGSCTGERYRSAELSEMALRRLALGEKLMGS